MSRGHIPLRDCNQNFWQLACITGAALGLPAMVIGGELVVKYGPGTALISVIIGNLILWIIGLGIISMARHREHAIENIKSYLGKSTGIFAALIWVLALLIWYALQIQGMTEAAATFDEHDKWQIGTILGLLVALLGMGGIRLIKWGCVCGLPILICYAFYILVTAEKWTPFNRGWNFSFSAILSIVVVWLLGTVNLPTFFRHSRSRADSILGLSLATLFHAFFQVFTILVGIHNPGSFISQFVGTNHFVLLGIDFTIVLLTYILSNLLNIYCASVGWETITNTCSRSIEYLLVGLSGTVMFIIFHISPGVRQVAFLTEYLESILISFIASLGVVLVVALLIRIVIKHRPRQLEMFWSSCCWFVGCVAAIIAQSQSSSGAAIKAGMIASAIFFLIVIFVEEAMWSIKCLYFRSNAKNR